jgi:hypothetical protein
VIEFYVAGDDAAELSHVWPSNEVLAILVVLAAD